MTARHVILVGLPGAGKSTVGPTVAEALGRPFVDFDVELERRTGRSVREQFAHDGEEAFRAREAALSVELGDAAPAVLAPGGGWMTNSAASAPLQGRGRIIYLRTAPEAALGRLGDGVAARPLLSVPDPLTAMRALLARRSSAYEGAGIAIDTDGLTPAEVAGCVVAVVQREEARTDG